MRISDWSSDVCSSDLTARRVLETPRVRGIRIPFEPPGLTMDRRIAPFGADLHRVDEGVEVTRHVDLRITLRKRAVGEARSRRTEVDLRGAVEHVLQHVGRERHRQALIGEVPRDEVRSEERRGGKEWGG